MITAQHPVCMDHSASDSHYHLVSFYHPNDVPHDMMMANEEFNDRTDWSLQDICRRKWYQQWRNAVFIIQTFPPRICVNIAINPLIKFS